MSDINFVTSVPIGGIGGSAKVNGCFKRRFVTYQVSITKFSIEQKYGFINWERGGKRLEGGLKNRGGIMAGGGLRMRAIW